MIDLAAGDQLIAEAGAMPNHAVLVGVDANGDQLAVPFLNGLPSGRAIDGSPFGPVAYALNGRNLYIALGEADQFHDGGPSFLRRAPLTPFVSAVIQAAFSADLLSSGPFVLTPQSARQLLSGHIVTIWDSSGNSVTLEQIASFGLAAHPSGVATLANVPNTVYVVDSGSKRLLSINAATHQVATLAQFQVKPESLRALMTISSSFRYSVPAQTHRAYCS